MSETLANQIGRRSSYERYARLYSSQMMQSWVSGPIPSPSTDRRLALNVVKSCVDAFVSKMTIERPKVTFLTSGGDWDLQEKSKDLEKFVDGQFYEMKLYEETPRIIQDACIYGSGILHIYIDGKGEDAKVACERVLPQELLVDDIDGLYGSPRSLFRRKLVDRLRLIEMFPEHAAEIEVMEAVKGDTSNEIWPSMMDTTSEMIPIVCAWHLRSSKSAEDGRFAIVAHEKTLFSSEWNYDYFPFAIYRRSWAPVGYWGIGLAEELLGIQLEINQLAQKIQRHHYLLATGHWMVEQNSRVSSGQIDNDISIIRYTGPNPPQVYFPNAMSADIYQHLWALYGKAFELSGISQLAASSQKPAGLNSGKAIDAYADITSERFATASRAYQDLFLDIARQVIDRAREITENDNPKYSVTSVSKDAFTEVEFLNTDLDESEAVLQMYPTDKLAKDPAERMSQVVELRKAFPTKFDEELALRLLDYPDIESATNELEASDDLTRKIVTKMLKEGKVIQPRPFMNLDRAIKIAQLMELRAEVQGAPEDRLELVRTWIVNAEEMLKPIEQDPQQVANMPPQDMPPVGAPPNGGMPPPMPNGMPQ